MDPKHHEQPLAILPAGTVFHARYEVIRCIRTGGMGAVYEVTHLETRRRRALKVMLPSMAPDPEMRARFKLEATVAADIQSEHIVEVFDAGVDTATGMPFLVMELLKGEDLGSHLERDGRIDPSEALVYLHQVALALQKTHAAGIVHRDLKPENLFVTSRDDGSPRVKILDFGIAKVVEAQRTDAARNTRSVGSPMYMAPEQIQGDPKLGPAADLYSLGHIAFDLLVGEPYWASESKNIYKLLVAVPNGLPEPASARAARRGVALGPAFDAWFARATSVSPSDRFGSPLDLVSALAAALEVPVPMASAHTTVVGLTGDMPPPRIGGPAAETATAVTTSVGRGLQIGRRRSRLRYLVAAVLVLGAGGVGVVVLRPQLGGWSLSGPELPPTATHEAPASAPPSVEPAAAQQQPGVTPGEVPPPVASASAPPAAPAAPTRVRRPPPAKPRPTATAPSHTKPTPTRSID